MYEFDSEIRQLEGKIRWSVIYFPYAAAEKFGIKGNIPVIVTVDGHSFDHTLLPSRNGHYLVYNEFIRQAVGKDLGDTVHITLKKDTKERKYAVLPYIEKALSDSGVLDQYLRQPDYLKREQANFIEVAKKRRNKAEQTEQADCHAEATVIYVVLKIKKIKKTAQKGSSFGAVFDFESTYKERMEN